MACVSEAEVLGFLRGALAPAARAAFEAHLDACAECLELVTLAGQTSIAEAAVATGDTLAAPVDAGGDVETDALLAGTLVGRYEIRAPLGRGGMGMVYTAHDTQLGRQVALKLVVPGLARDPQSQLALLREAQAMARITQPNVLTVYDTGTFGDAVFLAAERVDGDTLEAWLARPRRWRAIVEVFVQAARGLAAAHDAGLVHRDFKPTNALVGRDGRVRVFDFGVVRFADSVAPPRELAGTPLYMSPEQLRGDVADARSDQYAFCVALHEALFGELPGRPDATRSGRGARDRVPGWLRDVVRRGLQVSPAQRFPAMRDVIAVLERGLRRRRRWAIAAVASVAVAAAAATAGVAYVRGVNSPLERCPDVALEGWSPLARARIGAVVAATGLPYASATWARSEALLDQFAGRWRGQQRAACLAFEVHATEDAALHRKRVACLARGREMFAAIVDGFATSDGAHVAQAARVLGALPDIESCARSSGPDVPADAATRARVGEQFRRVARVTALAEGGHVEAAVRGLPEVHAGATAIALPSVLADASYLAGRVELLAGNYQAAATQLYTAWQLAMTAADDELMLATGVALVSVYANELRASNKAVDALPLIQAVVERLGTPLAREQAALASGIALTAEGRLSAARPQLELALQLAEDRDPPDRLAIARALHELGFLAMRRQQHTEAEAYRARAAELTRSELGDQHPLYGAALSLHATALDALGRLPEATVEFEVSLALRERTLGRDHPSLAVQLEAMVHHYQRTGDIDRAVALARRAIDIAHAGYAADHPLGVELGLRTAEVLRQAGHLEEADQIARRALDESRRRHGLGHHASLAVFMHVAENELRRGNFAAARDMCKEAYDLDLTSPMDRGQLLTCRAEALLGLSDRATAHKLAAEAVEIMPVSHDPFPGAWARFLYAASLPRSQRARAIELAREARSVLVEASAQLAHEIAQVDAWFARVGAPPVKPGS